MTKTEILKWLRESDVKKLGTLWSEADRVRRSSVGDEVHLRGIIAISNYCGRTCRYCGINTGNNMLKRYRMSLEEILDTVYKYEGMDFHTVVLQSGEDKGLKRNWITGLIERIKSDTNLAITLSLGERDRDELIEWKDTGAGRYLLKFETSNRQLFNSLHPGRHDGWSNRIDTIRTLIELGYEVGSGNMVGIPGQRYEDLVRDLVLFRDLKLDMIAVGPYIPHPVTDIGRSFKSMKGIAEQVPNDVLTTCKMVALARILSPTANIPSTTALAVSDVRSGRESGLLRGANVVMPDMTPIKYRRLYDIYPSYYRQYHDSDGSCQGLKELISTLGRTVSKDSGISVNFLQRTAKEIN